MIQRKLFDIINKNNKSILLLGPRQTGKSTLIAGLTPDLAINLARESTFLEFASDPLALEAQIKARRPAAV